jgi:protein involved in polysaccharide export with SLBB domain
VTVSPIFRVSDAIAIARGIRKGASYRQILLIRGDKKIPIDLVQYGLSNDDEKNPAVEPGDEIFVPLTAVTVSIAGQVRYPGVYELVPGDTIGSLMGQMGGILPEAQPGTVEILRFNPDGTTVQLSVNLRENSGAVLRNGDRLRVPSMTENREKILVIGAVFGAPVTVDKPIPIPVIPVSVDVPYIPGITLLSVLEALGGPTPYAKAKESAVIRAATGQRVLVDIETLWVTKNPASDIALEPGDTISIPMVFDVFVVGEVRLPGKVPYSPAFTVSDYIMAAGGVKDDSGDINGIYFVDQQGARTKAGLQDRVKPGTIIFADKNWWFQTQLGLGNVLVITGFASAVALAASQVISTLATLGIFK